jgi:hypothetical protein
MKGKVFALRWRQVILMDVIKIGPVAGHKRWRNDKRGVFVSAMSTEPVPISYVKEMKMKLRSVGIVYSATVSPWAVYSSA